MSLESDAILHTVPYKTVVEKIKKTDLVKATVQRMESIPPGANPFRHDHTSMGTALTRDWMVMHSGNFGEYGHDHLYLVNQVTGQRIGLAFEALDEEFVEDVYCGRNDLDESVLYMWKRNYDTVWFMTLAGNTAFQHGSKSPLIRGHKTSPVYVYFNGRFVRVDVFYDPVLRAKWCEDNEVSLDDRHPAVLVAKRWEAAQNFITNGV